MHPGGAGPLFFHLRNNSGYRCEKPSTKHIPTILYSFYGSLHDVLNTLKRSTDMTIP